MPFTPEDTPVHLLRWEVNRDYAAFAAQTILVAAVSLGPVKVGLDHYTAPYDRAVNHLSKSHAAGQQLPTKPVIYGSAEATMLIGVPVILGTLFAAATHKARQWHDRRKTRKVERLLEAFTLQLEEHTLPEDRTD